MSEYSLITLAQSGDGQAFRQLVETYAGVTERTARVLLADRNMAEDAIQEAWLDAWRGLPSFHAERPFRPWLLAIVANRCRMSVRKHVPVTVPYNTDLHEGPGSRATYETIAGEAHDVVLQGALARLDETQRQVIALRYYADLSLDEIADVMQAPLGTVKSRLHRALATLRALLSQEQELETER